MYIVLFPNRKLRQVRDSLKRHVDAEECSGQWREPKLSSGPNKLSECRFFIQSYIDRPEHSRDIESTTVCDTVAKSSFGDVGEIRMAMPVNEPMESQALFRLATSSCRD